MKIKTDFVTNSSSTSYILIKAGDTIIAEAGDSDSCDLDGFTMDIDNIIKKLQDAKAEGVKVVDFTHGGGYEG